MSITIHTGQHAGRRFWQAHVRALAASGFSRREYCRRHHLSYHALTYWVRQHGTPAQSKPLLALIEVPVRLHLGGGRMLEIGPDFDEATLGKILAVLEQRR
jgi:hypothetical protein